jgi:hypothetical protein
MCNCGNKRNEYSAFVNAGKTNTVVESSNLIENKSFEYTGSSGMTVKGTVTGRTYRFHFHGDRQLIDPRDQPGLQKFQNLHPCG